MGKLTDIQKKLKEIFPEALDFSADEVIQGGIYLVFNSLTSKDWRVDICRFSLLIASRSMAEDKDAILPLVDKLRERLGGKKAIDAFGADIFVDVSAGNFRDTLYVYTLNMQIELFREMENLKL
jgi:EAL domain-containing protein (putative c-di-GMP-specific phosphodiesterase class I)